jgi:hypothetical protein
MGNATFNDLKHDAQKALAVLINQPEVDPNKITLLGHGEGTMTDDCYLIVNTNSKISMLGGSERERLVMDLYYNQLA